MKKALQPIVGLAVLAAQPAIATSLHGQAMAAPGAAQAAQARQIVAADLAGLVMEDRNTVFFAGMGKFTVTRVLPIRDACTIDYEGRIHVPRPPARPVQGMKLDFTMTAVKSDPHSGGTIDVTEGGYKNLRIQTASAKAAARLLGAMTTLAAACYREEYGGDDDE